MFYNLFRFLNKASFLKTYRYFKNKYPINNRTVKYSFLLIKLELNIIFTRFDYVLVPIKNVV